MMWRYFALLLAGLAARCGQKCSDTTQRIYTCFGAIVQYCRKRLHALLLTIVALTALKWAVEKNFFPAMVIDDVRWLCAVGIATTVQRSKLGCKEGRRERRKEKEKGKRSRERKRQTRSTKRAAEYRAVRDSATAKPRRAPMPLHREGTAAAPPASPVPKKQQRLKNRLVRQAANRLRGRETTAFQADAEEALAAPQKAIAETAAAVGPARAVETPNVVQVSAGTDVSGGVAAITLVTSLAGTHNDSWVSVLPIRSWSQLCPRQLLVRLLPPTAAPPDPGAQWREAQQVHRMRRAAQSATMAQPKIGRVSETRWGGPPLSALAGRSDAPEGVVGNTAAMGTRSGCQAAMMATAPLSALVGRSDAPEGVVGGTAVAGTRSDGQTAIKTMAPSAGAVGPLMSCGRSCSRRGKLWRYRNNVDSLVSE